MATRPVKEPFHPALLNLIERTNNAGVWVMNAGDAKVTISEALVNLLGIATAGDSGARGNVTLYAMLGFFAEDSRALMAASMDSCMTTGRSFDEELQLDIAAGKRMWVRATGEALRDDAGGIVGMHGVLQDISGKKRVQNEAMGITMRLSTTLASIREAFVTVDRQGRFTYVNRESENLFKRQSDELLGRTLWNELDAHDTGLLRQEFDAMVAEGSGREFEHYCEPIGKWLELRAYAFEDGVAVYFRDVTSSRRSQEQLLLLETSISRLNDIVLITEAGPVSEPGPRIVFVNDAFERHTGYSREEALGRTPRMLQGPATQRVQLNRIRTALKYSQPVRAELINYRKNGEPFWMELEIAPVDYFNRGLTHWVSIARDITERKAAEDKIEHLAFFDALTQLPNRQLLMDRLKKTLSQCEDSNTVGALMFIDLDNFKVLNDTMGHSRGDLLLVQAGLRLAACSRPGDTVARLGGDEFVVMLEDLGDSMAAAVAQTRSVGELILAALSEPYELAGHQHHSTCSIGITLFSKHEQSIGDLLKQADLAMYQAKAAGRNGLCFFDPEMQAAATANATLGAELRQSLRNKDFVLHYQPQVGHKGMFGVEALVRWKHPRRGLVFPDAFIPQAEESGLIMPLGKWVLETACAQLARWALSPATAELSIAVNVSARQFRHPDFVDEVMTLISHTGIQASRLKLELTESLLASDVGVTVAKMVDLKKAGLTLSIDDFGMGYSALSYLKYLPLDQLKIDRTFVKDVLTDPNDAAIARTIIGLAQSLGLNVVAEGVETEAQRAWLEWFGCENYQGHLFCPALPIDELEVFMHALSA
ncbi:MAG: EAL domain-containing protein [Pseudomonadota bacterium]